MNLQHFTQINIGKDVEQIIMDYLSQLEFTEKYDRVLQQLLQDTRHQVINHSRSIILRNDRVVFYDYEKNVSMKSNMLIIENTRLDDEFVIIESNYGAYLLGWWENIFGDMF